MIEEKRNYKYLYNLNSPADLRKLKVNELPKVCDEVRDYMVDVITKTGGHFGAGLGVVELTVAMHYVYNTPIDKIIFDVVKSELKKIFDNNSTSRVSESNNQAKPYIILVIGVNGAGKTTTIGKLAYNYKEQGKKVLIAASDTFRAAASEQLEIWSERAKADIVISEKSVDPSAVAYEAIEKAHKEKYDVLLIDTAGRLHTKSYLMDELVKLNRIITKKLNRAPDETLLVLDGNSGQNAVVQSDEFSKTALITGLVITKLDGTAKGGIVFQIFEKQKIPVKYIGVGEDITDLQPFNAEEFISAIVDIN